MQQGGVMGMNKPSVARNTSWRAGVGRRGLRDVFRVRKGHNRALRYLKHDSEGGCGQTRPPTHVSSEAGGGDRRREAAPTVSCFGDEEHSKCDMEGLPPPCRI